MTLADAMITRSSMIFGRRILSDPGTMPSVRDWSVTTSRVYDTWRSANKYTFNVYLDTRQISTRKNKRRKQWFHAFEGLSSSSYTQQSSQPRARAMPCQHAGEYWSVLGKELELLMSMQRVTNIFCKQFLVYKITYTCIFITATLFTYTTQKKSKHIILPSHPVPLLPSRVSGNSEVLLPDVRGFFFLSPRKVFSVKILCLLCYFCFSFMVYCLWCETRWTPRMVKMPYFLE